MNHMNQQRKLFPPVTRQDEIDNARELLPLQPVLKEEPEPEKYSTLTVAGLSIPV